MNSPQKSFTAKLLSAHVKICGSNLFVRRKYIPAATRAIKDASVRNAYAQAEEDGNANIIAIQIANGETANTVLLSGFKAITAPLIEDGLSRTHL